MKQSRWFETLAKVALLGGLLSVGTGCGAIKAAANPKVAWALNDPAPMSVVVRRVDVAEKTSKEVDRLMNETPLNDDSPWLAKVGTDKEVATKDMADLRANDFYATGPRVVAAEVWAKELGQLEPKKPATPAPVPAATVAKKAEKAEKAEKKKPAATEKKAAKAVKTAKVEKAPAAAPPPPAPKYVSLLDAIDPDLGAEWAKVMEKKKAFGDAKGEIAVLEAANDAKGISDADKKANKARIAELEKTSDALEKEAEQLSTAFIPKAKASAQKSTQEKRDRLGPAIVNLRQATVDAGISAGAAAVRYPMAVTTLLDSAKQMAKIYVADVIEEKTGKRPSTQSLQPGVTMEGGNVEVTLNGLTKSDLGQLSIGDVTKEVASRTGAWAKRALGLLGTISATKEVLSFEEDVLTAILDGWKAQGWAAPAPVTMPEAPPAGGQPRS